MQARPKNEKTVASQLKGALDSAALTFAVDVVLSQHPKTKEAFKWVRSAGKDASFSTLKCVINTAGTLASSAYTNLSMGNLKAGLSTAGHVIRDFAAPAIVGSVNYFFIEPQVARHIEDPYAQSAARLAVNVGSAMLTNAVVMGLRARGMFQSKPATAPGDEPLLAAAADEESGKRKDATSARRYGRSGADE